MKNSTNFSRRHLWEKMLDFSRFSIIQMQKLGLFVLEVKLETDEFQPNTLDENVSKTHKLLRAT
jgi:hypothetical protein